MITCQAVFIQYWNVTDGRTDRQTDRIPISISCWCTIKTRALRECKSPPTPKFQPKVIRDSNLDFRINPDPDVCRICPKMLGMHYLVGVSYFAKYGTSRPLIVWEILTNVQKSPTPQRWRKWKKWSRINTKKVNHLYRVTPCPCLPSLVDVRFCRFRLGAPTTNERNEILATVVHQGIPSPLVTCQWKPSTVIISFHSIPAYDRRMLPIAKSRCSTADRDKNVQKSLITCHMEA